MRRAGPTTVSRARAFSTRRGDATDGGRFGGDGRPASIFFVRRRPPSFATRDLRSFVRVARARALVRDALRASRRLADADARREVTEEIARYARDFPGPIAEASEEEGARALAEAKRRVRELEEMIGMVE